MTAQERPRGATPRPRSGEAAGRSYPTSEVRGRSREDPMPERRQAKKSHPTSEVRGCGREELPHVPGAVAVRAQEGLEELFHVQGQEGRW